MRFCDHLYSVVRLFALYTWYWAQVFTHTTVFWVLYCLPKSVWIHKRHRTPKEGIFRIVHIYENRRKKLLLVQFRYRAINFNKGECQDHFMYFCSIFRWFLGAKEKCLQYIAAVQRDTFFYFCVIYNILDQFIYFTIEPSTCYLS